MGSFKEQTKTKIITGIFLIFFLSVFSSITAEDQKNILTLAEAFKIALKHNHSIRIANNIARIAGNSATAGNAGLLPKLSVSAGSTWEDLRDIDGLYSDTTYTSARMMLSYTLFDGLGNIYRYKKLKSAKKIAYLETRQSIEATLFAVSSAYYRVAEAFENLQIVKQLLQISADRLKRAKKKAEFGQARSIDVLSARVDYHADKVKEAKAIFTWEEGCRNLNVLLSRKINSRCRINTQIQFARNLKLLQLQEQAIRKNAGYLAARERLLQSSYDLHIAGSGRLPRLDLTSSVDYAKIESGLALNLGEYPSFSVGASLSFDIFDGNKTVIAQKNALISQDIQKLALEQIDLFMKKDVINAFAAYNNSLLVLELEKQTVKAAELNFKRARELYNMGQITYTQFREAQLSLVTARGNVSAAKYNARLQEIELHILTGSLLNEESRRSKS